MQKGRPFASGTASLLESFYYLLLKITIKLFKAFVFSPVHLQTVP
jgi:hypothetical protein